MRWPIRNQILVPFAAILLAAVAVTSLSAAFLAARRSERAVIVQLNQVIDTLGHSNFPYSENVLLQMRGLSGAEFVAFDGAGNVTASTLPAGRLPEELPRGLPVSGPLEALAELPAVGLGGTPYLAVTVARPGSARTRQLLVLYPETSLRQTRREAALPPLIVGGATIVVMVIAAAWVASRLGSRIRSVQRQVAAIAAGDFLTVAANGPVDEIRDLIASVNRMSGQLQQMQHTIARTERAQLLGQLAGGLAHQLRNAVTGARLAVEIHQRRCAHDKNDCGPDDSLDVALHQLRLTEEQVKGLLTAGRPERHQPVPSSVRALVDDIASLVGPACQHAGVDWTHAVELRGDWIVTDSDSVRTAVLNLALNAIEAAGSGGHVELTAAASTNEDPDLAPPSPSVAFAVRDDGPGPPADLADGMFDLFVTGKPEGVGFGLALAKQAADRQGGDLTWSRTGGRTEFLLTIPAAPQQNPAGCSR